MKRPQVWFDGYASPLRQGAADLVLCTEVIEHVTDPQTLLNDIARVLAPGGVLLLTAPQTWGVHEPPFDFFRYTEFGLRLLLERAGFVVQRMYPVGGVFAMVAVRLSAYLFYLPRRPRWWKKLVIGIFLVAPLQILGWLADSVSRGGDPLGHAVTAVKV